MLAPPYPIIHTFAPLQFYPSARLPSCYRFPIGSTLTRRWGICRSYWSRVGAGEEDEKIVLFFTYTENLVLP